jgi:hypothetical protein
LQNAVKKAFAAQEPDAESEFERLFVAADVVAVCPPAEIFHLY